MTASVPSNNDYFYPGSIVKCINCYDLEIQGEVITFDRNTGALVLSECRDNLCAVNIRVLHFHHRLIHNLFIYLHKLLVQKKIEMLD